MSNQLKRKLKIACATGLALTVFSASCGAPEELTEENHTSTKQPLVLSGTFYQTNDDGSLCLTSKTQQVLEYQLPPGSKNNGMACLVDQEAFLLVDCPEHLREQLLNMGYRDCSLTEGTQLYTSSSPHCQEAE